MAAALRKVIRIDEKLCNGCGLCVPACAEGALQIIDGKAKLVSDKYCDGLGACLGDCPTGAISFEEREAEEYDEHAVMERLKELGRSADERETKHGEREAQTPSHPHGPGGCPGSRMLDFRKETPAPATDAPKPASELRQWPVKLNLVNPGASYFKDADLLLAADCTAFACASLHPDFMRGKAVAIGCPKFDDIRYYTDKLQAIIQEGGINSITVIHMEVPCCTGLLYAAKEAIQASGRDIPLESVVISIRGDAKPSPMFAGL